MKLGEWEGLLDKNTHKMSEDTFYWVGTRSPRSPGGAAGGGRVTAREQEAQVAAMRGEMAGAGERAPPSLPAAPGPRGVTRRRGCGTIYRRPCSTLQAACRHQLLLPDRFTEEKARPHAAGSLVHNRTIRNRPR